MRLRRSAVSVLSCAFAVLALALVLLAQSVPSGLAGCPITPPPKTAFVPPAPYTHECQFPNSNRFCYGTAGLWTFVRQRSGLVRTRAGQGLPSETPLVQREHQLGGSKRTRPHHHRPAPRRPGPAPHRGRAKFLVDRATQHDLRLHFRFDFPHLRLLGNHRQIQRRPTQIRRLRQVSRPRAACGAAWQVLSGSLVSCGRLAIGLTRASRCC